LARHSANPPMDRHALYFRLSLVWLALIVGFLLLMMM
jgi:hypothetical protein